MEDERKSNNGVNGRRPWILRYWPIIAFFASVSAGGFITLKMDSTTALAIAKEAKAELAKRAAIVNSVPHIEDKIQMHVEEFKDFKNEQRSYNKSITNKLDQLLLRGGS